MNNLLELVYSQLAPNRLAAQVGITPDVLISVEVMEPFAHS